MTGIKIINQALSLLGYSENDGNNQLTQRVMNRALPIVNLVYGDLSRICSDKIKKLNSLSDKIDLPEKAIDIFACGLASYIASSEGDDNAQYFWSNEYQTRRATLSKVTEYKNVLPTVEF